MSDQIYLYGTIEPGRAAREFVAELRDCQGRDIELHVNSSGGNFHEAQAIHAALERYRGHVTVVVDGLAASAASFVIMAADRILVEPNASVMIHEVRAEEVSGTSEVLAALADQIDQWSDQTAAIYAARAGGSRSLWRDRMRQETTFSAREAVAAGLADALTVHDRDLVGAGITNRMVDGRQIVMMLPDRSGRGPRDPLAGVWWDHISRTAPSVSLRARASARHAVARARAGYATPWRPQSLTPVQQLMVRWGLREAFASPVGQAFRAAWLARR